MPFEVTAIMLRVEDLARSKRFCEELGGTIDPHGSLRKVASGS